MAKPANTGCVATFENGGIQKDSKEFRWIEKVSKAP